MVPVPFNTVLVSYAVMILYFLGVNILVPLLECTSFWSLHWMSYILVRIINFVGCNFVADMAGQSS